MDKNTNSLNWFEIPAVDISRATKFYETIFGLKMEPMPEMPGMDMKMISFPSEMGNGKVAGALVQSKQHKPSMDGAVIYLNANPKIDEVIGKIENAGGKIIMPKMQISPEIGYMAFFIDSEGNRMALHAQD
jgi:uncharacterized protein